MSRPALHLTSITARNGTPAAALTRALASNAAAVAVADPIRAARVLDVLTRMHAHRLEQERTAALIPSAPTPVSERP